jgi:hypothetical protein
MEGICRDRTTLPVVTLSRSTEAHREHRSAFFQSRSRDRERAECKACRSDVAAMSKLFVHPFAFDLEVLLVPVC